MAHKCKNCPQVIHSSRTLCNKCNGVTPKAFEKEPAKTKGGYVGDKWVSGKEKARIAGMDELRDILAGDNSTRPIQPQTISAKRGGG